MHLHQKPVRPAQQIGTWLPILGLWLLVLGACSRNEAPFAATTPTAQTAHIQATTTQPSVSTTQPAPTTTVEQTNPLEVHVSPDGADTSVGTIASPVRTVERALALVAEGGSIVFHEGTYPPFVINERSALTLRPRAGETVTVEGTGFDGGSGIFVDNSDRITIDGLDVKQVLWGIWVEESSDVIITRSEVSEIGQEGMVVKKNSQSVQIVDNVIHSTGLRPGQGNTLPYSHFGEGIYIGNAGALDDGSWDQTYGIRIERNHIFNTTAEAIDIKPWADGILIESNLIHDVDTTTSGAVVVGIGEMVTPASDVTIIGNVIHSVTRTSPYRDGNAIVVSAPATVVGNVIWGAEHFGILVDRLLGSTSDSPVVVRDNLVLTAGVEAIVRHDEQDLVPVSVSNNETGERAAEFAAASLGSPMILANSQDAVDQAWLVVAALLERRESQPTGASSLD